MYVVIIFNIVIISIIIQKTNDLIIVIPNNARVLIKSLSRENCHLFNNMNIENKMKVIIDIHILES